MSENERATKPHVAAIGPAVLDLEPGTYYWCRCGFSQNQPFCDGHHKTMSTLTPLKVVFDRPKKGIELCRCKHTHTPPYCDGTHETLSE